MKRTIAPYRRTMAIRYSDPGKIDDQVVQLQRILATTQTAHNRLMPGFTVFSKTVPTALAADRLRGLDCDEVYPGIFIGDERSARNKDFLQMVGVTHVLNCAEGTGFTMVATGSAFYADAGIQYHGINVMDVPQARISGHFHECANFIERALKEGGGVLSHCYMGLSRSATMVVAFLMIKRQMSCEEAVRTVRRNREVRPNDGFLRQLLALESKLLKE